MYLMYLDESGFSRLNNPKIREQSNFFVLGGLIIKEEDYFKIDQEFKLFKKSLFSEPLCNYPIHAVDLNNILISKYNKYKGKLSDEEGKQILLKCYEFISKLPIEAIAIIIDNYNLTNQYKTPENPYYLAYTYILEKFQLIVSGRKEIKNQIGIVNLAESSKKLNINLINIHNAIIKRGTSYVDNYSNIFCRLNIEPQCNSSFYEISDLICYAFQRAYYTWLCENLNLRYRDEGYLKIISPICTLKIGSFNICGIRAKIFPQPRFLKKEPK
ncbi:MAG: DUF3800 domain-containing protein [Candidatus Woesearchaeota archaeon]